jgi:hypothetical protein
MDPNDKEQYDYLLSIVDPSARFGPDEEALLTVFLIFFISVSLWFPLEAYGYQCN